jgi:hypothetical protein
MYDPTFFFPYRLQKFLNKHRYLLIYLSVCIILATPGITGVWNILFAKDVPAGMDVPRYISYTLRIIDTKNPLIPYSAFPDLDLVDDYYPSFLHIIIGLLTVIANLGRSISFQSVLSVLPGFMFLVYLAGIVGYALLIKKIIDKSIPRDSAKYGLKHSKNVIAYIALLLLAFGVLFYCSSPMIKTFRDGAYGTVFCMWTLFPFYIILIMDKRWILASLILATIAWTHNLSITIAVMVTLMLLLPSITSKELKLRKLIGPVALFVILSSPAIMFFYIPSVVGVLSGEDSTVGHTGWWNIQKEIDTISLNLYVIGGISTILLLAINPRNLGWLAGWSIIYLVVSSIPSMAAERWGRELALSFGLTVGIILALWIYNLIFIYRPIIAKSITMPKIIKDFLGTGSSLVNGGNTRLGHVVSNRQLVSSIVIVTVILIVGYNYFVPMFIAYSDPTLTYWFSNAMAESNKYFLSKSFSLSDMGRENQEISRPSIVVFGQNWWLNPTVYGKFSVLNVMGNDIMDPISAIYSQPIDRSVNDDLRAILDKPNSKEALKAVMDYNIHYIYIASMLPNRFYPLSDYSDAPILDKFKQNSFLPAQEPDYINLERIYVGEEGEKIRIYSVDQTIAKNRL